MSRFSRQALRDNRSKKKRGSSSRAFLAFAFLFLGLSLFFLFERYSAVHHYAEDSPLRKVLENAKTDRGSSLITDPLRSLEDKKKKLPESDAGVIAKTDVIEKKSQDDTDNSPQEKKADDDTIEDSETEKSDAANLQHLQHSPDFAGWENNGDHGAEIALPADQQGRTVYFVNISQVSKKDSFSASWLQSKNDFLGMDLSIVQICEDAAFKAWYVA